MAIVGEDIKFSIQQQIVARQTLHGSGTNEARTNDQIAVLNSQNAWVKMASGVSVDKKVCDYIGVDHQLNKGSRLAQNYILFGGVSKIYGTNKIWPLEQRQQFLNDRAYENSDFGITPMPGIISVKVKPLNRGSIKKATIQLKAYNRNQFYIIDTLYLRLGYSIMLEWGNNIYTKNGTDKLDVGTTLIEDPKGFFSENININGDGYKKLGTKITDLKYKHYGNYDGMIGKITNFDYSFKEDGSYDISLELHSLGDVIESLTINPSINSKIQESIEKTENQFDGLITEDSAEQPSELEKNKR